MEMKKDLSDEFKIKNFESLFEKYISLVKQVHGCEKAMKVRDEILNGKSMSRYYIEKWTGQAYYTYEFMDPSLFTEVDESRISHVNIYPDRLTDRHRLICKIDGKMELSELLDKRQDSYWKQVRAKRDGELLTA